MVVALAFQINMLGSPEPAGKGEGDDGEIILAPLPDFPYLRKRNNQ